jgi:hypothetical protein
MTDDDPLAFPNGLLRARLGRYERLRRHLALVQLQTLPRTALGRDRLQVEDRLAAAGNVLSPWHSSLLCSPEARVTVRCNSGTLQVRFAFPEHRGTIAITPDLRGEALSLYAADPLVADRLNHRVWRCLGADRSDPVGRTARTPFVGLEDEWVDQQTGGRLCSGWFAPERGAMSPSSARSPWRHFVRIPLAWLQGRDANALTFEVDWPETAPGGDAPELLLNVALFTDQVLAMSTGGSANGWLAIPPSPDFERPNGFRVLALWNDAGTVLAPADLPWLGTGPTYRVVTDRATGQSRVQVPADRSYTAMLAFHPQTPVAITGPLTPHRGSDRIAAATTLGPSRSPLDDADDESLWRAFAAGALGAGVLARPIDLQARIRGFAPFGVSDFAAAAGLTCRSEARRVDGTVREVHVLTIPTVDVPGVSARDLEDARAALCEHLQLDAPLGSRFEVEWRANGWSS